MERNMNIQELVKEFRDLLDDLLLIAEKDHNSSMVKSDDITICAGMRLLYKHPEEAEEHEYIVAECADLDGHLCLVCLKDGSTWSMLYGQVNGDGIGTLRDILGDDYAKEEWRLSPREE